jgi:ubiquinone biosynthesis UbiH/UbiF/VisC/COQ6 family hydroxylase
VGADGASSKVRSAVGIEAINKNYRQRAVVSHITTEKIHGQTAWQRFLPDGPLAFLPLSDGRSSIVWTNTEAQADRLIAASDDEFLRELETASAGVLGRLGPCTQRFAFGLRLTHAVRYVAPGVALIGDAAHAVHPLAGQGMNLGLRDSAVLADTLVTAVSAGAYPGDERVLKRYERAQKAHNVGMQLAFDGLNELFSRRIPAWATPMRSFGLALVDRIGPAKRLLMRQALGVDRHLNTTLDDHAA